MEFVSGNWYHIYNRGNNRQPIFFQERNYLFFIDKMSRYLLPHCDLISYVLMPNHFHFLIAADERAEQLLSDRPITINILSEGIRLLLSSYSKAINNTQELTLSSSQVLNILGVLSMIENTLKAQQKQQVARTATNG